MGLQPENASVFARVKRFRESWLADERVRRDPRPAAVALGLDPESLAAAWQSEAGGAEPEALALREVHDRVAAFLTFVDDDEGVLDAYRGWRARQKARAYFAQGYVMAQVAAHAPWCVELTRGCSFGCWFCGLSAAPLEKVLPTDLVAWREMLEALRGIFGRSGDRGFLYWASDPLDHPDYEAHGEVFREVFGRFPATTTVAALVDPARTRRLIETARAGRCPSLRFSVVTLRQMAHLHSTFSAQELADVELVPVNRESTLALAETGHLRRKVRRWPKRVAYERRKLDGGEENEIFAHRTIACVSGFLVEPVAGRVRLISPEPCSDRWPDGYAVFGEARYEDPAGFRLALHDLVERHMGSEPPPVLALQRGVEVRTVSSHRATAIGRGHEVALHTTARKIDHLPALAAAFLGGAEVAAAARAVAERFDLRLPVVRRDVAELWRQGVLIETVFDFADAAPNASSRRTPPGVRGSSPPLMSHRSDERWVGPAKPDDRAGLAPGLDVG